MRIKIKNILLAKNTSIYSWYMIFCYIAPTILITEYNF